MLAERTRAAVGQSGTQPIAVVTAARRPHHSMPACGGEADDLDCMYLFLQAEVGIRDYKVTGVQTCALPICSSQCRRSPARDVAMRTDRNRSAPPHSDDRTRRRARTHAAGMRRDRTILPGREFQGAWQETIVEFVVLFNVVSVVIPSESRGIPWKLPLRFR